MSCQSGFRLASLRGALKEELYVTSHKRFYMTCGIPFADTRQMWSDMQVPSLGHSNTDNNETKGKWIGRRANNP